MRSEIIGLHPNRMIDGAKAFEPITIQDTNWPELVPFEDFATGIEFPSCILPPIMSEMVDEVAKYNQVDKGLPGSLILAAISTCVAKKAHVNLTSHSEPLNLYMVFISGSGERKSSTVNDILSPIQKYQAEQQKEMSTLINKQNVKNIILEKRLKSLQDKASKSDDSDKIFKYQNDALKVAKEIEENPILYPPTYLCDDITPESLGIVMSRNSERLSLISAEGGIFQTIGGRYTGIPNLDLMLKSHAGDPWSAHRVGREAVSMDSPALTMGLAVQPDVLSEIGSNQQFKGRGLMARLLIASCPSSVGSRKRQNGKVSDATKGDYANLIHRLLDLPFTENHLYLSEEAQEHWDSFYNDIEKELNVGQPLENLRDWGSKLPGAVARIAGLLHFTTHVEKADKVHISLDTIKSATALGAYYRVHALKAFQVMGQDTKTEAAKKILEYINHKKPLTFKGRDVLTNKNYFKNMDELEPGLKILLERNYIRELKTEYQGTGRPPTVEFEINPLIRN